MKTRSHIPPKRKSQPPRRLTASEQQKFSWSSLDIIQNFRRQSAKSQGSHSKFHQKRNTQRLLIQTSESESESDAEPPRKREKLGNDRDVWQRVIDSDSEEEYEQNVPFFCSSKFSRNEVQIENPEFKQQLKRCEICVPLPTKYSTSSSHAPVAAHLGQLVLISKQKQVPELKYEHILIATLFTHDSQSTSSDELGFLFLEVSEQTDSAHLCGDASGPSSLSDTRESSETTRSSRTRKSDVLMLQVHSDS